MAMHVLAHARDRVHKLSCVHVTWPCACVCVCVCHCLVGLPATDGLSAPLPPTLVPGGTHTRTHVPEATATHEPGATSPATHRAGATVQLRSIDGPLVVSSFLCVATSLPHTFVCVATSFSRTDLTACSPLSIVLRFELQACRQRSRGVVASQHRTLVPPSMPAYLYMCVLGMVVDCCTQFTCVFLYVLYAGTYTG